MECFSVDCSGQYCSGGLAIFWKMTHLVSLQSCFLNHIGFIVMDPILMKNGDLRVYMDFLMINISLKHGT